MFVFIGFFLSLQEQGTNGALVDPLVGALVGASRGSNFAFACSVGRHCGDAQTEGKLNRCNLPTYHWQRNCYQLIQKGPNSVL